MIKKIQRIQIHSKQLAQDILAGAWHSAFKGRGMEFEEVREYQTGDEIRSIDWNVTARMNHPYIKIFKEERELTVLLLVDVSASTRFGHLNQLKKDLIAEIGGVLAFSAIKNSDNIGLVLFSDKIEKYIPPRKGTRHVLRLIRELLAYEPTSPRTNLLTGLNFIGALLRKPSICFLISDFLSPIYEKEMSIISKKHDLISINVSDPYETEFPSFGLIQLKDLESNQEVLVNSSNQKFLTEYKQKNLQRLDLQQKIMNKIGVETISITTNASYVEIMKKFFKHRKSKR